MVGCGWVFAPWPMEYSLTSTNNFVDCRRLIRESLVFDSDFYIDNNSEISSVASMKSEDYERLFIDRDNHEDIFRYQWQQSTEFILLVNILYWQSSSYTDQYTEILKACMESPLLVSEYFLLLYCSPQALQSELSLTQRSIYIPGREGLFVHKPDPLVEN